MDSAALLALMRRPAVRRFDSGRPVPAEIVEQMVEVARWTGSARNRQPWRFVAVRDRDALRRLSLLGAYAQFVADAPVAIAIASAENGFADTPFDAGRVTQSLVLAAGAAGLGCCPATLFPEANVETARSILGLAPAWSPRHLLAIGYPAPERFHEGVSAVPSGRLAVGELLTVLDTDERA